MRGANASDAVQREAQSWKDIVFIKGVSAFMHRSVGPLASLLGWLRIVVHTWPDASFYGKADDDIWLHPASIASSLQVGWRTASSSPVSHQLGHKLTKDEDILDAAGVTGWLPGSR